MNRKERRAAARHDRRPARAATDNAVLGLLTEGMRHQEEGRRESAASYYRAALQRDPDNPDALHLLGLVAQQSGDNARAVELIGRALALNPDAALYRNNMGAALRALGRHDEAVVHYRRAAVLDPCDIGVRINLGNALDDCGETAEAVSAYRAALALDPAAVDAHIGVAGALVKLRDIAGAKRHSEQAVALDPVSPIAHNNLGSALVAEGRLDEAITAFRKAVELDPGYAEAWFGLGTALQNSKREAEAEPALRAGLALRPSGYGWQALGNTLSNLDRTAEAIEAYRRAIALDPGRAVAHNNLGSCLRGTGRNDEAIGCFDRAIEIDPAYAYAASNRGLALLGLGRFAEGWRDYRHRHSIAQERDLLEQAALPEPIAGRRMLVLRDQGLGDEIFFLRFVRMLKVRGARILYRGQTGVAGMIGRLPFIDEMLDETRAPKPEDVDLTVSAGDLPFLLGMGNGGEVPASITLPPLPDRVAEMRARLARTGPPPWIGITWRAGIQERNRLSKIAPQDELATVFSGMNATLVALQRNPLPGEIDRFGRIAGRPLADFTDLNHDLEGMLALVGLLDDYVCVSNTNVHLRAARGRTSRVLVPNPPDYRWMTSGDESPWFPETRVYREVWDEGWSAALRRLADDLAAAVPVAPAPRP